MENSQILHSGPLKVEHFDAKHLNSMLWVIGSYLLYGYSVSWSPNFISEQTIARCKLTIFKGIASGGALTSLEGEVQTDQVEKAFRVWSAFSNMASLSGAWGITSDNGGSYSMSAGGSDGARTLVPDTLNGENTQELGNLVGKRCFRQGDYIHTSSWSMTSTRKRRKVGGGNSATVKRTMNQAVKMLWMSFGSGFSMFGFSVSWIFSLLEL